MSTAPETVAEGRAVTSADDLPLEVSAGIPDKPARTRARPIKIIRPPAFSMAMVYRGVTTLADYWDLLYTLSLFRLNVRYKQSVLGWVWAALQPLALMTIYTIIFTRVTKVATSGIPYPVFVLSGLLPWIFFSSAVSGAAAGLVVHPHLLTKMYFPREIIPLSYLLASLVDFCIACFLLGCMLTYYRIPLGWHLLYAIPIMSILAAFAAAIALFFSAVQVRFRDVGLAMPFVLQIWMFTLPVVYSLQSVPPRYRSWYLLDPAAGLIDAFRNVILHGTPPEARVLLFCGTLSVACLAMAYAFFKSSETTMADNI